MVGRNGCRWIVTRVRDDHDGYQRVWYRPGDTETRKRLGTSKELGPLNKGDIESSGYVIGG